MVAKIKASNPLPNSHQVLFQEQQQILFNGNEVSNSQKLSAIGVKDDDSLTITVSKKGVGAGVVASSGSANNLSFNTDGSSINPSAFQQHFRRDSNLMAQLFLVN
ncbi:unnamed protein product [Lathyrus sativus]|nr:unnamed protein product [Lathyrus sativus]